jgi:L-cysteine desulfidase
MNNSKFLELLSQELVIALGCTEPIAVAYAAALARQHARGSVVTEVTVYASGNVIKNAMSVMIPGTELCGVDMAAALGVVAGDAGKHLEVLAGLTPSDIGKAVTLISQGFVSVHVAKSDKRLYIEVSVQTSESCAKVVIADEHTRVEVIEVDGLIVEQAKDLILQDSGAEDSLSFMDLETIWEFVRTVDSGDLGAVRQSMELNGALAEEGLRNPYGLQVGKTLKHYVEQGLLGDDFVNDAMALTAAGTDARMAGCPMPAVSNSGSGNQGISATVPVLAVGKRLNASRDKMLRAVTLSNLISIYIKAKFGRLSALCGAVVSGTGASCGITYLLDGGLAQVKMAIQNMLGNVTGMICDGAKPGCALKVATCTSAAAQSALLAARGLGIQSTDGIIETSPTCSIDNLCRIGNQGTIETDKIILEIMLNKQDKNGAS